MKWALESPTERALLRAMYHGPRPLSAVWTTAQKLSMRSVPHDGDVMFSTDATERPAIATGLADLRGMTKWDYRIVPGKLWPLKPLELKVLLLSAFGALLLWIR